MADFNIDLTFQPKELIPEVVFQPAGTELSAEDTKKLKGVRYWEETRESLCRACGWTTYNELTCSYLPRLRVFHTRGDSGLWTMGNDYALWDRSRDKGMNNDYITYQFLKEKGLKNIPLLEEMHQFGKSGDSHQFTVMSRAKGAPLRNVWPKLSREEQISYVDQLVAAIRELRQYTAPYPQRVDGGPLWDSFIGQCSVPKACINIGKTIEGWFNNMDAELRRGLGRKYKTKDNAIIEEKLKDLKSNFPDGGPYVLTHADLNSGNIIVNKGKIQAIIGWELAGYYPWWAERWAQESRCRGESCVEICNMVWAKLDAEHDSDAKHASKQFTKKVTNPVDDLQTVLKYCPITHSEMFDVWRRPAWCECKPLGGLINRRNFDSELKHEVDYSETARATYNPEYSHEVDEVEESEVPENLRVLSM
jgi:hypothetical protein